MVPGPVPRANTNPPRKRAGRHPRSRESFAVEVLSCRSSRKSFPGRRESLALILFERGPMGSMASVPSGNRQARRGLDSPSRFLRNPWKTNFARCIGDDKS